MRYGDQVRGSWDADERIGEPCEEEGALLADDGRGEARGEGAGDMGVRDGRGALQEAGRGLRGDEKGV